MLLGTSDRAGGDLSTQVVSATFMVVNPQSNAAAFVLTGRKPGSRSIDRAGDGGHVFDTEGNERRFKLRSRKGRRIPEAADEAAIPQMASRSGRSIPPPTWPPSAFRRRKGRYCKAVARLCWPTTQPTRNSNSSGRSDHELRLFPTSRGNQPASRCCGPARSHHTRCCRQNRQILFRELNNFRGRYASPVFFDEANRSSAARGSRTRAI